MVGWKGIQRSTGKTPVGIFGINLENKPAPNLLKTLGDGTIAMKERISAGQGSEPVRLLKAIRGNHLGLKWHLNVDL